MDIGGIPPISHLSFQCEQSQAVHTLFTQLMLERDFLAAKVFYATYAHQDKHVNAYLSAVREVFGSLSAALATGMIMASLKGPVAHSGFHRLT